MDYNLLVDTAVLVGEIMLKNGSETYMVEQTIEKLLKTTNMKHVETVVTTTSIVVTLSDPKIEHITAVSRIHEISTNLNRIYEVNKIVDLFCKGKIKLQDLFKELKKLKNYNQYNNIIKSLALIFIPPAFTIMLNGTRQDSLVALICGFVLVILTELFQLIKTNAFIKNSFSIFIVTIISGILSNILGSSAETVIIGVMMPYVPGIAITNAARDSLSSDYMSGSARLLDALIQALSVAIGVFSGIFIIHQILGGM